MKRAVSSMLVILLLLFSSLADNGVALQSLSEQYAEYVAMLDSYMDYTEDNGNARPELTVIRDGFHSITDYEHALEFEIYTTVMLELESNPEKAGGMLFMLEFFDDFKALLESKEFSQKYKHIGTLDIMNTYQKARCAEMNSNLTEADALYRECIGFFDSKNRLEFRYSNLQEKFDLGLQVMKAGNLGTALQIFEDLKNVGYEGADSLYFTIKELINNNDKQITTPTPTPTPTPTKKSTTTKKPTTKAPTAQPSATPPLTQWSAWSDWGTQYVSASNNCEVEQKVQYAYIDTRYMTEYSSWGTWSDWSTTAADASSTCDVETKVETQKTYKTTYKYRRYQWTNGTYTFYAPYDCSDNPDFKSGGWQYATEETPLVRNGEYNGYAMWKKGSAIWFNETEVQEIDSSKDVTYYRTRMRTEQQIVHRDQSAWSDTSPEIRMDREILTRIVYRFRTR